MEKREGRAVSIHAGGAGGVAWARSCQGLNMYKHLALSRQGSKSRDQTNCQRCPTFDLGYGVGIYIYGCRWTGSGAASPAFIPMSAAEPSYQPSYQIEATTQRQEESWFALANPKVVPHHDMVPFPSLSGLGDIYLRQRADVCSPFCPRAQ